MSPTPPPKRLAARWLAAALLGLAAGSAGALKVDMYAIGNWSGGDCAPGDTDANRPAWPGMAQAWYVWMGLKGHQMSRSLVDGNLTLQRFCDPVFDITCKDYLNVDWPGAAIIAAHGFDSDNAWGAVLRNSWKGRCDLRMGSSTGNTFLGDTGLRFLHASSCSSLNDNYFSNMRVAMKRVNASSSKGLHVMTGFHGVMWISSAFNGDYADTAVDGQQRTFNSQADVLRHVAGLGHGALAEQGSATGQGQQTAGVGQGIEMGDLHRVLLGLRAMPLRG